MVTAILFSGALPAHSALYGQFLQSLARVKYSLFLLLFLLVSTVIFLKVTFLLFRHSQ